MPTLFVGPYCVAALLCTALVALAVGRQRWGSAAICGATLVLSLAGMASALWQLLAGLPVQIMLSVGLPGVGAHFRIDALAAFFLVVVNLGGAGASLYAIGHTRHEAAPLRVLPFFPGYLAGMNLVVMGDDAFTFLSAWVFMSLMSWALVMAHHTVPANARAGLVDLLMASFGTLALLFAFGILVWGDGGYAFDTIRAHRPASFSAGLVLLLVFVGAGSKAGLVPLHVALPLAHPAAPSHISALMSGVMTKVAIYGFIRIVFDLLGEPAWWWSLIVLTVASVTAVIGVLYAMMQHDLKRLLSCSTIENVGIVFIGLGLAMAFRADGMDLPAALALTAALFHVLNHSIVQSLLSFGAGAALAATGERSMDRLGGLIHTMPRTAVVVLVGCAAISGLPTLNGFVSEWLTFQAILASTPLPQWELRFLIPVVGALLALAVALTAACFVKFYGIAFLGRPRTPQAGGAREADRFSLSAMFVLAGLCCLIGLFPGLIIEALSPVVHSLVGGRMPGQGAMSAWTKVVPLADNSSAYNGATILIYLLVCGGLVVLLIRRFAWRGVRRAPAWDCGYPNESAVTQYSAASFAMPIRRAFRGTIIPVRQVADMPAPGEMRAARLRVRVLDPAWRWVYGPAARMVIRLSARLTRLRSPATGNHLGLMFVMPIAFMLTAPAWH